MSDSMQDFRAWYAQQTQVPAVIPRLIFGLDATASRQATWDQATEVQIELFKAAGDGISVQLVYYRDSNECRASAWLPNQESLAVAMRKITCVSGNTQIGRLLGHVLSETTRHPVKGLVFVGDAFEEYNKPVVAIAKQLGEKSCPCFMLQEGEDRAVAKVFQEVAKVSGGFYAGFNPNSAAQLKAVLKDILRVVAQYATSSGDARIAIEHAKQTLSNSRDLVVR